MVFIYPILLPCGVVFCALSKQPMIFRLSRIICGIIFTLSLAPGCASGGFALATSVLSSADVVSQVVTGRGTLDNVISSANDGKDCRVFRAFQGEKVCVDKGDEKTETLLDIMLADKEGDAWVIDDNDVSSCIKKSLKSNQ